VKTHLTRNIILEFEEIKLFICDDFLIVYDSPIRWQHFGMEMTYSVILDMLCYLPIQQNEARRLFAAQRMDLNNIRYELESKSVCLCAHISIRSSRHPYMYLKSD
jgi:hypothetical protein